jgi:DNA processing protein
MGHGSASLDALCDRTGLSASEINARLSELELDGRVARLAGGHYQRLQAGAS